MSFKLDHKHQQLYMHFYNMILSSASSVNLILEFNELKCKLRFPLESGQNKTGTFKIFVGIHLVHLQISFMHKHPGM